MLPSTKSARHRPKPDTSPPYPQVALAAHLPTGLSPAVKLGATAPTPTALSSNVRIVRVPAGREIMPHTAARGGGRKTPAQTTETSTLASGRTHPTVTLQQEAYELTLVLPRGEEPPTDEVTTPCLDERPPDARRLERASTPPKTRGGTGNTLTQRFKSNTTTGYTPCGVYPLSDATCSQESRRRPSRTCSTS